jgi:hypothetical protein
MGSGYSNLFFIPILAEALRSPSPKEALLQAFQRIRALGEKKEYQEGFSQFEQFMEKAIEHQEAGAGDASATGDDIAYELSVEIASDTFEGDEREKEAAFDLILSRQEWRETYEKLCEEFKKQTPVAIPYMTVVVERDDRPITEIVLDGERTYVENILPGPYALRTSTGRVIWRGDLTPKELFWTDAYPDRALDLAASTDEEVIEPTAVHSLLDGEVVLRIFAGIESGRVEITFVE